MKKKKILKYSTGGSIDEYLNIKRRRIGELPNSIETPDEAIAQNELNLSKALVKSENGLTNTLDFLGAAGLQIGTSMMSQGSLGENPSGLEKALFNNKDSIIGALNILGGSSQIGGFHAFGGEVGNNIDWDKLLTMYPGFFVGPTNNGLKQTDFNSLFMNMNKGDTSQFALGGSIPKIPVEVEGQEVAELPNGQVGEFQGPSHEDGGIKMNLPEGTDIYSKRIKVEGKTMAERKLARERKIESLMKLIEKNPLDKTLRQTLKKIQENNTFLDEKDMLIQNTLHSYNQGIKRAYGGTLEDEEEDDEELNDDFSYADYIDDEEEEDDFYYDDEEEEDEEEYKMGGTVKKFALGGPIPVFSSKVNPLIHNIVNSYILGNDPLTQNIVDTSDRPGVEPTDSGVEKSTTPEKEGFNLNNLFGNISLGDAIGMAGSLKGAYTGKKNTLANRASDNPNINHFKNYGKEGLETLKSAKGIFQSIKDSNLEDINRARVSIVKRNNNSARGINTQRALNLASDSKITDAKNKVYQDYATKLSSMLLKQADLENQQDLKVMAGEAQRDLNDRKDKDNFYTQLGIDEQSIATGIQKFGKNLNKGLERKLNAQALSMLSKWFNSEITSSGLKTTGKKTN